MFRGRQSVATACLDYHVVFQKAILAMSCLTKNGNATCLGIGPGKVPVPYPYVVLLEFLVVE